MGGGGAIEVRLRQVFEPGPGRVGSCGDMSLGVNGSQDTAALGDASGVTKMNNENKKLDKDRDGAVIAAKKAYNPDKDVVVEDKKEKKSKKEKKEKKDKKSKRERDNSSSDEKKSKKSKDS